MPVTEVCFEVGYNNISNFNRHFLAEKGVHPFRNTAECRPGSSRPRRPDSHGRCVNLPGADKGSEGSANLYAIADQAIQI